MPGHSTEGKRVSRTKPRHQITRSITELSSPIRLHRHPHDHEQGPRDEKFITPLSAGPAFHMRSSMDNPRAAGSTPGISPDPSRRGSALVANDTAHAAASSSFMQSGEGNLEEELRSEKKKTAERASGLKQSLAELNAFSNLTTRRLDDAYYSVLEKLGVLQGTVMAIKELALMAQEMTVGFDSDAGELVQEIESQLDAFGDFEEQEQRIQALQNRVADGRDKIQRLSQRVDTVRQRVESWEMADRHWQEKTRKRLRAIWVVMSVLVLLIVVLFISAQYVPNGSGLEAVTVRFANENMAKLRELGKEAVESNRHLGETGRKRLQQLLGKSNGLSGQGNSTWIHVFDEL